MVLESIQAYSKRLKQQSLIVLVGFSFCLVGLIGIQQYFNHLTSDYDTLINISGRQRMLSQRLAYLKSAEKKESNFKKELKLFLDSQDEIKLKTSSKIQKFISKTLEPEFNQYIFLLEQIQVEDDLLLIQANKILPLLNEVVTILEAESNEFESIEGIASGIVVLVSIVLLNFLYFSVLKPQRQDIVTHLTLYDEAKHALEESLKAKSIFLANMTHELRTPLNGIMRMADFLEETKLSEEQKDYVQNLKTASKSLLDIVNDILDLSKFESGQIRISPRNVEIRKVLLDIEHILVRKAQEKLLDFSLTTHESVPHHIKVDPLRLKQILLNLLNNSIKFTERGKVSLFLHLQNEELKFVVSDTGIGISELDLDKIFDEFNQVENPYVKTQEGTGLGLSLVKNLVELMNGKIKVSSTLNQGTSFYVTLPFEKADLKPSSEPIAEINTKLSYFPQRTLIAEDNKMNQMVISTILKKLNLEYDIASNGKEAVEMAQENKYDLILMDISMPEMSGFEATELVRKFNREVPIFCLSANVFASDKQRAFSVGMNEFISKPVNKNDLILKINEFFSREVA